MMSSEGSNLENLLERVVQLNMLIIEEMNQQRKQINEQQEQILARLPTQPTATAGDQLLDPSLRLLNKINVKPKDYHGTNDENVVTWLMSLEEIMHNPLIHDDERISLAVSLLGGTALQWFVNL